MLRVSRASMTSHSTGCKTPTSCPPMPTRAPACSKHFRSNSVSGSKPRAVPFESSSLTTLRKFQPTTDCDLSQKPNERFGKTYGVFRAILEGAFDYLPGGSLPLYRRLAFTGCLNGFLKLPQYEVKAPYQEIGVGAGEDQWRLDLDDVVHRTIGAQEDS